RPLDALLQPDRGRPEPALRVRVRHRHRALQGARPPRRQDARPRLGPARLAQRRRHRQPLPVRRRRRRARRAARLRRPPRAGAAPRPSPPARGAGMIRVAILDPHPAVRVGLEALLRGPADTVPVGAVAYRQDLWPLLYRADPDAVVIGDSKAERALRICLQVRSRYVAGKVVIYAPAAGTEVAAAFAGAHAVVDPEAGVDELLRALRSPEPLRPPLTPTMRRRAAAPLPPLEKAILAMTLAGTPASEIAQTVGLDRAGLAKRRAAILDGSAAAVGPLDHARQLHA